MPFCCVKLHLKKREPLLIFTPYTAFPLSMATGHNAIMLNNFAYLISWRSRFVPSSVHFPIKLPVPLTWCGERALCSVMQFQQPRVLTSLACDLLGRMPSEGLCFLAVTLLPLQETAEQLPGLLGPEITSGATHLCCSLRIS